MITGDYRETAVAIAKELKIMDENSKALTGVELDKMDDNELEKVIDDVDVYARVSPQHKVRIVSVLKKKGEITAMTGDGVNDAPALKKADIGVAMGITGTDVAKETAEMILIDDNFASIISAIEEGRIIFSNIRKFVFFLLTCNIAEILVIFLAMVLGWPIPLIPIQILWLNLVTDAFPALALGMEPGEPGIMKQPPRNPDEPILNRKIQRKIIIQSIAMTAATLGIYYLTLQTTQNLTIARTFAFVTLSTSELLRAFTVRSETTSVFELGLFSNKYMLWGNIISFILILMVVYVPFLRNVFQTVPLTLSHWAYILAFAAIPFAAAEIGKALIKNGS
jgi:Ca2+-transporting ATPase